MSVFDPQNQILASLQQYADSALDELNGIAGNNIDKWKVGLRDIQNWDDGIIGEEVASLLELDYNIMQLLFEIVHDPPELAEFLHVFMIELSKVSCVKNREYFTKFGHVDRSNVQKSVLTRVFRKLSLRPKFKTPASTTPSLASASSKAPSKAPSRTPSRTPSKTPSRAPSTCSKRSCASASANKSRVPNVLDQISEDQSISLAPSDSVSCLPNQKTPSVVREGSVAKSKVSRQYSQARQTQEAVPEDKEISLISEVPDFQQGPMFFKTKTHDLASFASIRSKAQSTTSSKFPSAQPPKQPQNDMMSGVSLIR